MPVLIPYILKLPKVVFQLSLVFLQFALLCHSFYLNPLGSDASGGLTLKSCLQVLTRGPVYTAPHCLWWPQEFIKHDVQFYKCDLTSSYCICMEEQWCQNSTFYARKSRESRITSETWKTWGTWWSLYFEYRGRTEPQSFKNTVLMTDYFLSKR